MGCRSRIGIGEGCQARERVRRMSRRIDIELTSQSGDGTWTWRAAGARQPKGTLDGVLVPAGEKVGSVLQATVEVGLDGMEVLALAQTKPVRSPEKSEG